MHVQTPLRCHFSPVRLAKVQIFDQIPWGMPIFKLVSAQNHPSLFCLGLSKPHLCSANRGREQETASLEEGASCLLPAWSSEDCSSPWQIKLKKLKAQNRITLIWSNLAISNYITSSFTIWSRNQSLFIPNGMCSTSLIAVFEIAKWPFTKDCLNKPWHVHTMDRAGKKEWEKLTC
jgi:hypothetical protein